MGRSVSVEIPADAPLRGRSRSWLSSRSRTCFRDGCPHHSEGALNICFLHPRLGPDLPVVSSTCEYSRGPVVTKSQVAPCSLLVLIYCLNVLFWSVLAGAISARGDGASSQLLHTHTRKDAGAAQFLYSYCDPHCRQCHTTLAESKRDSLSR